MNYGKVDLKGDADREDRELKLEAERRHQFRVVSPDAHLGATEEHSRSFDEAIDRAWDAGVAQTGSYQGLLTIYGTEALVFAPIDWVA